jgi:hypothetical protein
MSPGKLNSRILADRVAGINRMLKEVGKLPLDDYERFNLMCRSIMLSLACSEFIEGKPDKPRKEKEVK